MVGEPDSQNPIPDAIPSQTRRIFLAGYRWTHALKTLVTDNLLDAFSAGLVSVGWWCVAVITCMHLHLSTLISPPTITSPVSLPSTL